MRHFRRLASAVLAATLLLAAVGHPAPAWALPAAEPLKPVGGGVDFSTPPGCAAATDNYAIFPDEPIPDNGVITSTIDLTGVGSFLWDLTVTTDITHTWSQDLDIFLISPAGSRVTLTTDNGGNLQNVFHGATWTDKAGETNPPGPVTLVDMSNNVPVSPVAPEEPLGALRGEDPNGDWVLEVHDDDALLTGTLVSWGLELVTLATAPASNESTAEDAGDHNIPANGAPLIIPLTLEQHHASLGYLELLTNIFHPRSNELIIELVSPSGITMTVAHELGGPNANVFGATTWSDKFGTAGDGNTATDTVYTDGVPELSLTPQEPLSAAAGSQPGGQWTVQVRDTTTNAFTGTVNYLSLLSATSFICRPVVTTYFSAPDFFRMDEPMPVFMQVKNDGAPTTGPVYMTATLPVSTTFLSASGPGWTCGAEAGQLGCQRASLAAGQASTVTLQLNPPTAPANRIINVVLSTLGRTDPAFPDRDFLKAGAHSANDNPWDVMDEAGIHNPYRDDGSLYYGGQNALPGWGRLRLRVFNAGGNLLLATPELRNFGMAYSPGHRWRTTTPQMANTIQVARSLYAPPDTDWLRYVDTFTNTGSASRTVWVAWGGDLGSYDDTLVTDSSSGDGALTAADTWAVTAQDDDLLFDFHVPPAGFAVRSPADTTYQGPGLFDSDPFTTTWPSAGAGNLGHIYKLVLAPGESASLAYFVYRGLTEGEPGPQDCEFYGDCVVPATGSQVALAHATAAALAANPNFCDLSQAELNKLVNWPGERPCGLSFLYLPLLRR
jgi:subtilisin-like proprotein convertase family protein